MGFGRTEQEIDKTLDLVHIRVADSGCNRRVLFDPPNLTPTLDK